MRSMLHLLKRKTEFWECGNFSYQTYESIKIIDEFTRFTTKKNYETNYNSDCNEKNLMYLLSSKTRGKQYLGNTTKDFRSRWNSNEGDVRKVESVSMENVKQKLLQSHFYKVIAEAFMKMLRLRWVEKHRLLIPLSRNSTERKQLKQCTKNEDLRISSVNVAKSAVFCKFGHIYWRNS